MCRISGIINKRDVDLSSDIIRMRDAMKHGGPDSEGVYLDQSVKLALGHRRLSIIDMTHGGDQPMISEDKKLVLIFNGEIYNFLELKEKLSALGCRFHTHSDTEVILLA